MNRLISKFLFFLPLTTLKGEIISLYLRKARSFQYKSQAEIEAHQVSALKKLLVHAKATVPYYKKALNDIDIDSIQKVTDLSRLPFLTKKELISSYHELCSSKSFPLCTTKTTGGSTGQAVTLRKNATALARERAVTARAYEWAGIGIGSPQARLWGIPLEKQNRAYYRIVDLIANRKRISAFDLSANSMREYLKILQDFKPEYLYGYASAIEEFVVYLRRQDLNLPNSLKSVITTSEVLSPAIRKRITESSGLPVFNEYGCGEVGSIAHECEQGTLHLMADNLIVEILDENGNAAEQGELVVTDLFNYATPLICYKLKDYGTIRSQGCTCGRTLPCLEEIHGRAYDMILSRDGKKFHPEIIMYAFEAFKRKNMGIEQFQVVQNDFERFTITLVVGSDYDKKYEAVIRDKIDQLLDTRITAEFLYLDQIDREKSGKIRLVKSEVPRD